MKVRLIVRSLDISSRKFEFGIWLPKWQAMQRMGTGSGLEDGHVLGCTLTSDKEVAPGQQMQIVFDWPFPDFKPKQCRFKASLECSLKFDILVFEAEGEGPPVEGSGTLPSPGGKLFS